MTLEPYDVAKLDALALRFLDLAAIARDMSIICGEHDIETFALHDRKARQWWENLERWLRKARAELEMVAIDARATRRTAPSTRCGGR